MNQLAENIEKICLIQNAKLDLLGKYMTDWIELRSRVNNAHLIDFDYHSFDRWLSLALKRQKAISIYGEDVVDGNIGGLKFEVNIVDKLRDE